MSNFRKTIINNWSLTKKRSVRLFKPKNTEEILEMLNQFKSKNESFSILGSGNSYGDCTLSKYNIIDIKKFNKIIKIDRKKKIVKVEAGVKLKDLINFLIPKKLILNNLPGSFDSTIGGVIASNVHGKDSFKNGVFGNNVIELKILNKFGKIKYVNRKNKQFKLFIGTHGVHGIILEATLSLKRIPSNSLEIISEKFKSFKKIEELFEKYKNNYNYMGCWVDHFDLKGRGVFQAAKWEKKSDLQFQKINNDKNFFIKFFHFISFSILKILFYNGLGIRILNFIIFYFSTNNIKNNIQFKKFYYPQENLLPYEVKLYQKGKINIQILIPKKNFSKYLNYINKLCRKYKFNSWWLGIKKHKKENYINNFALDGYDITLQWSKKYIEKKEFKYFYKNLMKIVVSSNSVIYLTQDILLSKNNYKKIFSNIKFNNYLKKNKKNGIFNNELYSRITN